MPEKIASLEKRLRDIASRGDVPQPFQGKLAVAFSGGLDSRFLVHMGLRVGLSVVALHVNGPHIPSMEHRYAVAWAQKNKVSLQVVHLDPLTDSRLENNPIDRCYHCKTMVFSTLCKVAAPLPLCDGTNATDLGEYRPGLRALAELRVISPLAECGITKEDIRCFSATTGLATPNQAAQPCLLTRFDYGFSLNAATLAVVDKAENAVRTVLRRFGKDETPFRLRYETPTMPALHMTQPPLDENICAALCETLADAGLPEASIRVLPSLSGYFDRKKNTV